MNQSTKEQLVYKVVQYIELPAKLDVYIRTVRPKNISSLAIDFEALSWRLKGQRLNILGQRSIVGTLILPSGRLRSFSRNSDFALQLPLPEELISGHNSITPVIREMVHTVSREGRNKVGIRIAVSAIFGLTVMAARPSAKQETLAKGHFITAFLPVVLFSGQKKFYRELLLPLDPPGLKIVRADVDEKNVRVYLGTPSMVSGSANEEIIYLGSDGRIHGLNHTTDWNHFWPEDINHPDGANSESLVAGKIIRTELINAGHTLSIGLEEIVILNVSH